jgi:hypothetical protein
MKSADLSQQTGAQAGERIRKLKALTRNLHFSLNCIRDEFMMWGGLRAVLRVPV